MTTGTLTVAGRRVPVHSVNTVVVGSGAAALKAAVALHARGLRDLVVVTEAWGGGTSANAGSDKQTYYKLSLAGGALDSPGQMAEDLFAGGCVHGDIALAEASQSAEAFYHLVEIGVPFPHDVFGGFPGYRTDHDPRGRATSAGPLTSHLMVEALAREVERRGIDVLDHHQVVSLLVDRRTARPRLAGAVALATGGLAPPRFVLFNCVSLVLGTGGPGGLYADSVYPAGQTGSIGAALRAGAVAQNLGESQFGLASTAFRWNVSGSYQQVVPRYVSTDPEGGDEREFLNAAFPDMRTLAGAVFRKGYQWPFDARRVAGHGSSLVDLLVYRERTLSGRRVFLDYTRDPEGDDRVGRFTIDGLDDEAAGYLAKSGALGPSPIDRLRSLNAPAIALYRERGIDLAAGRLEIAVCAQHNNGGLRGNLWWESNIEGLFPVGEVNGSHGVYRPGGAALNAGQVGGLRAATYIARRREGTPPAPADFLDVCRDDIEKTLTWARAGAAPAERPTALAEIRAEIQARMSRCAAHIRVPARVRDAARAAWMVCDGLRDGVLVRDPFDVPSAFRTFDLAVAHALYLEAIAEYIDRGGQSRGSYLIAEPAGAGDPHAPPGGWRFSLEPPGSFLNRHILEISLDERAGEGSVTAGEPVSGVRAGLHKDWVAVRPIPDADSWFESAWKAYREDEVIR
jgi:succinate dehydrogenase/fumarate reductase flavoprotein subunit